MTMLPSVQTWDNALPGETEAKSKDVCNQTTDAKKIKTFVKGHEDTLKHCDDMAQPRPDLVSTSGYYFQLYRAYSVCSCRCAIPGTR